MIIDEIISFYDEFCLCDTFCTCAHVHVYEIQKIALDTILYYPLVFPVKQSHEPQAYL